MPPTLQAALVPLIVMALTAIAVKMQVDSKAIADNILAIATALAALIVAGYGWIMNRARIKKIETAETRAPGITEKLKPTEEVTVTQIVNDTSNDSLPASTKTYVPPTEPGPQMRGPQ